MTPEAAKKFIDENNIKFILAQFVDIHGVAKTKSVPASCLMDVVENGAGFAGFAVWGLDMEPHSPDFMARGDLSTLSLVPWPWVLDGEPPLPSWLAHFVRLAPAFLG